MVNITSKPAKAETGRMQWQLEQLGQLEQIVTEFRLEGRYLDARPHGTGHIHDTFLVNMKTNRGVVPYIVQRINHQIFRDPPALMENIVRVTAFIRQKLEQRHIPPVEISRRVLTVVLTRDGASYYKDAAGNYWRVYLFIGKAATHDVLHTHEQAGRVAFAFGEFLALLSDFPGPPLHEIIPGFHDGLKRWREFREVLAVDTHNRAGEAGKEIDFLQAQADVFRVVPELIKTGQIPARVSHNDTKVNNVLLDTESGAGICVLDLDTVMNGTSLYDFGDLARSALSAVAEDSSDLSGLTVEIPRFAALVKGFLAGVGEAISRKEVEHLVFSTKLMPLIIGMRFLSDYLAGDVYFKVHRAKHNLERCRRQFQLVRAIMVKEEEMNVVVHRCC